MENTRVLIDTGIVIEYLRSYDKENTEFVKLFREFDLCISVISVFELNNGATNKSKQNDINAVCRNIEIVDFDLAISKKASEIYRSLRSQNKLIEFRDILIGATAVEQQITIATKNKKHFERIPNIQIIDW